MQKRVKLQETVMKNQKGYSNIITNFIYGEKPVGMTLGKPFWFTARVFFAFWNFQRSFTYKNCTKNQGGARRRTQNLGFFHPLRYLSCD